MTRAMEQGLGAETFVGGGFGAVGEPRKRIGAWEADAALNVLRCDGQEVRLEPRVMEVLMFLVERAGEVVSRSELLERVWPGVVVGDDALTQAVIKLRKGLGDDPRAPRYIQTVPKRGYLLLAPVDRFEPSAARVQETPGGKRGGRGLAHRAVVALTMGVGLALGIVALRSAEISSGALEMRKPVPEPPSRIAVHPIKVVVEQFHVLGDHADPRYLAQGFAAELAADLSRITGLSAARGSRPAGIAPGARTAADRSRFRVFGAVQRLKGRLAVDVRLVDGAMGRQIWSMRYIRPSGDLFTIRDELASRVADALIARITEAEASVTRNRQPLLGAPLAASTQSPQPTGLGRPTGHRHHLLLGSACFFLGDYAQALEYLRAAALRNPADLEAHLFLAATLLEHGEQDSAEWEAEEIRSLAPDFSARDWLSAYPATDAYQVERLRSSLDSLRL